MTNIDKAADLLHQRSKELLGVDSDATHRACQEHAQALADAGLLTPDTDDITRLTIVHNKGRALEEWEINNLRLETQDDGRTLKIFYTKEQA